MSEHIAGKDQSTSRIIEPVSREVFFKDYWEKKPLYIQRTATNPFSELISISDIENVLSTNELSFPSVQLSHSGHDIAVSDYTDDNNKIVNNRILDGYRDGNTIVISQAQNFFGNLTDLCREVQTQFKMRCQTNVYLSPPGNQGFNPHYDTHDVCILQVSGKKTFNFYSIASEFPTREHRFDGEIHEVGNKTEEIVLNAGDTLYIPRGVVHDAVADVTEPSLHVTLGIFPVLINDVFTAITQQAFLSDSRLRRAIPQATWLNEEGVAALTNTIQEILQEHLHVENVAATLKEQKDEMALEGTQSIKGRIQNQQHEAIRHNTVLKVDLNKTIDLERSADVVTLRLIGQILHFTDPFGLALEQLVAKPTIVVAEIAGLSANQQIALANQLLLAGILTQR